jgi:hypothetical protein
MLGALLRSKGGPEWAKSVPQGKGPDVPNWEGEAGKKEEKARKTQERADEEQRNGVGPEAE